MAGQTPSEALEAQRRKRNEIIGEMVAGGKQLIQTEDEGQRLPIDTAVQIFLAHIKTHSPAKPRTLERYNEVLGHFQRLLGKKKYVEAVHRSDIDDYKNSRSSENVGATKRTVSPSTINFEVSTLRTFFYFLVRERGIKMENPCAHFKMIRSAKERLRTRPQTYTQEELDRLFAACDSTDRAIFTTFLLTGLRRNELRFLLAAGLLQMKGLIRYARGRITLLNPKGLEVFSCECYRILSRTIRSLLPPDNLSATDGVAP